MLRVTAVRHIWPEPAGFKFLRPQGHRDYTFLHFLSEVQLTLEGQELLLPAGSVILYDRGTPQCFESVLPLCYDWLHFSGPLTALIKGSGLETDRVYRVENGAFITAIIKEIEAEFFRGGAQSCALTELKLQELFLRLGRGIKGQEPQGADTAVQKFEQLRLQVFSTPEERWTVGKMAACVGYSPSRFNAIYHQLYGISPTADLIEARVERAKNLLRREELSVERIGQWLGYQNTTHFIRQFKSRVGVSPSVYRKNTEKGAGV